VFRNVLVPTDGSEISGKAVKQAVEVAKAMNAKLIALHAYPEYHAVVLYEYVGSLDVMNKKEYTANARAAAEKFLSAVSEAAKAAGVAAETVIVASDVPHEAIIKTAKRKKCDLIIMASHGRRGVASILLGSVTQKVLTHSDIPVLVLR
jgi:nucleotide-binding universal stress UspA family protein